MKTTLRIRPYTFWSYLFILAISNLPIWNYMGLLGLLNDMVRVIAASAAILFYVLKGKWRHMRFSAVTTLMLAMQVWLWITSLNNNGSIRLCIVQTLAVVAFAFVFEDTKNHSSELINGMMLAAETLCYINLLTIILFPGGLYESTLYWQNWVLGYKNQFVPYILVFCMIAFLYRAQGGLWFREVGIYVASFVSVILADSSTSIVGIAVLVIIVLLNRVCKIRFNVYWLAIINLALLLIVPVFRLHEVFSFLIEDILGRSMTFTGRTRLWDMIYDAIAAKPWMGYGLQEIEGMERQFGLRWAYHAHNLVFDYLYQGGFILLAIYVIMLLVIYKKLRRVQNYQEAQVAIAVLFVFQLMSLVEVYSNTFIYLIYFLAYYVDILIRGNMTYMEQHSYKRQKKKRRVMLHCSQL